MDAEDGFLEMSRTNKTVKNTIVGFICTGISYVLSFVLRALFIRLLGLEYSGVNSLFSDILKILSIADLGFGNAILYKLYKTIATGDDEGTEMFLALYKKICWGIGIIIGVAGLCFIPFLDHFVSETPSFPEPLWSLYIIVLATSVLGQIINYRSILITAKQDRYISIIIQYICIFLKHGLQIAVLVIYRNIYLYLLVEFFTTLIHGLWIGVISARKYHLSWNSKKKVSKEETKEITKDVGALTVFKFCRTLNSTVDTFLISKFIAVTQTAIYGSTTILTSGLGTFIDTLNDGMIASIGDLNATGDKDGLERTLQQSVHIMYLLYGTCTAVLVPFMSAFMNWWIGYTLSDACIYVLLFNFYTGGINSNISTYRNAMGLYRKGWKRPAATVVVNCLSSYLLILRMGIIGAFLGTSIANVTTMLWYDPLVVYKHGLNRSSKGFFARYVLYLSVVAITSGLMYFLGRVLPEATTFVSLCWHGGIYAVLSLGMMLLGGAIVPTQKEIIKRALSMIPGKKK